MDAAPKKQTSRQSRFAYRMLLVVFFFFLAGGCSSDGGDGTSSVFEKFVLYPPSQSTKTYLFDGFNRTVFEWSSDYFCGMSAFLQTDGSIIRAGSINNIEPDNRFVEAYRDANNSIFQIGGIVERISKESDVLWSFEYYSDDHAPHHVVTVMPNGNLLMPVWRYFSPEQCIALGRNPLHLTSGGLWMESIIEVRPTGENGGEIVWEWHVSDHLIQDFDPTRANFGNPAENPGRVDINYGNGLNIPEDFIHVNSAYYDEELDQIFMTNYHYSELWVIDHSTTTQEAAGTSGGRYGRGGELIYRWGNPWAYGRDDAQVFLLSAVHDPKWIPEDGHIILYDNNIPDPTRGLSGGNSRVVEIKPPMAADGSYQLGADGVYGPREPVWVGDLGVNAGSVGTAQRLSDGDTLSCDCTNSLAIWLDMNGNIIRTADLYDAAKEQAESPQVFRMVDYSKNYDGVKALQVSGP